VGWLTGFEPATSRATTCYDARTWAAEILKKAQHGEDPKALDPRPTLPLEELARRFREQIFPDLAASTRKEWGRLIDVEILPALGARIVALGNHTSRFRKAGQPLHAPWTIRSTTRAA